MLTFSPWLSWLSWYVKYIYRKPLKAYILAVVVLAQLVHKFDFLSPPNADILAMVVLA